MGVWIPHVLWRLKCDRKTSLAILMVEGRGWKHLLNALYPALLGASLHPDE